MLGDILLRVIMLSVIILLDIILNVVITSVITLSFVMYFCRYAEWHYAECCDECYNAERHFADGHYA